MLLGGQGTLGPTTGAITAYGNSLLRPAGCLVVHVLLNLHGLTPFVRAVSVVFLPAAWSHAPCPPSNTLDLAS